MCGISGIWERDGKPVAPETLTRFTRSLAHRGPDGEGLYSDENGALGLGHRRLAILDRGPTGDQPMASDDGRYRITCNGEIYNFLELRRELEGYGYRFRGQSDTEVILAAYDRWGPECQHRFNGMWAFAIWDRQEKSLFLSRDRFGVKPLLYLLDGKRFAFASELKAFRHLDGFQPHENSEALALLVAHVFALEGSEETLFRNVRRLRPGHCLLVTPTGERVWRWWNTLDHLERVPRKLPEQAERFRELLFDACRLRLRSDVPVATCLSGGLDSSSVLCSIAALESASSSTQAERQVSGRRAFVATYPGLRMDESDYARVVVEQTGAEAHFQPIHPEEALGLLDEIVYAHEDLMFTAPVSYWMIYRELRRAGFVVSLDGHGSDEMLGGYAYFTRALLARHASLLRAPRRTFDLVNTVRQLDPADGAMSPWRMALRSDPLLSAAAYGALSLSRRLRGQAPPKRFDASAGAAREAWLRLEPREHPDPDREAAQQALGPLNAMLYRSFHYTSLPTSLRTFDRCSMAHGVEMRAPFLDWRLVCYVFSLPEASKVGGGFTKRVQREAMRGILPEAIRTRRGKTGFNAPLAEWFSGPLRGWLQEQVNDPDFLDSDLWDGHAVRGFVQERARAGTWSGADAQRVWRSLHAHRWRHVFLGR